MRNKIKQAQTRQSVAQNIPFYNPKTSRFKMRNKIITQKRSCENYYPQREWNLQTKFFYGYDRKSSYSQCHVNMFFYINPPQIRKKNHSFKISEKQKKIVQVSEKKEFISLRFHLKIE